MAADTSSPFALILLDLTAALNTVDHNILLHCLKYTSGLSQIVLTELSMSPWAKQDLTPTKSLAVSLGA